MIALRFAFRATAEGVGGGEGQTGVGGRVASVHARHWLNGSLDDASLPLSFKGSGGTFRRTSVTLGPLTDVNLLQDLLLKPKMMQMTVATCSFFAGQFMTGLSIDIRQFIYASFIHLQ